MLSLVSGLKAATHANQESVSGRVLDDSKENDGQKRLGRSQHLGRISGPDRH